MYADHFVVILILVIPSAARNLLCVFLLENYNKNPMLIVDRRSSALISVKQFSWYPPAVPSDAAPACRGRGAIAPGMMSQSRPALAGGHPPPQRAPAETGLHQPPC